MKLIVFSRQRAFHKVAVFLIGFLHAAEVQQKNGNQEQHDQNYAGGNSNINPHVLSPPTGSIITYYDNTQDDNTICMHIHYQYELRECYVNNTRYLVINLLVVEDGLSVG